jgi:hypothetical protein
MRRRRGTGTAGRGTFRGAAFEITVLGVAMIGLGAAMVASIVTAASTPGDLELTAARNEIAALVRARGDSVIAGPLHVSDSSRGRALSYDTLAITGDSTVIPSLARGGFVRDHIEAFNDNAVRSAWRGTIHGGSDVIDERSSSLLRLARTEHGRYFLSPTLNPFVLTVRGPGLAASGVPVRASDWRVAPAFLGLHGAAPLLPTRDEPRESSLLSYSTCRTVTTPPTNVLLYCGLSPGLSQQKQFDLKVRTSKASSFDGALQLSEDRRTALWLNGARVKPPVEAHAGDLISTSRIGPAILSMTETGWLAAPQWVDGRRGLELYPSGSLRWFARAGRSTRLESADRGALSLSLDASLTRELDEAIARFVDDRSGYLETMSVVVADLSTGAVRTIAEYDPSEEKPLLAFEPVLVGSMSKPLVAAAILARQPDLASLTLDMGPSEIAEIDGLRIHPPLGNPTNRCSASTITFEVFLQCSNNRYAATLVLNSLQRSAGRRQIARDGRVTDALLESSALAEGLLATYDDLVLVATEAPLARSSRLWQRTDSGTASVPGDVSLLPFLSRPVFMHPDSSGSPVHLLARYAIGGWENRWTLVGALEGYARIATDRRLRLSLRVPSGAPPSGAAVDADTKKAFRAVRGGLQAVASRGTAAGLDATLGNLGSSSTPLTVFAKTGTLNEDAERAGDAGVFLKALTMLVGKRASVEPDAPLRCGLGIVVYLQFRQDWREVQRLPFDAKLPDHHRLFVSAELEPVLRRWWQSHDPCVENTMSASAQSGGR